MRRAILKISSLPLAMLLSVVSLGVHAGVLPQLSSHGADHNTIYTSSCTTVCNLTPQNKDGLIDETDRDDKEDPDEPYYVLLRTSSLDGLLKDHRQRTRLATNLEPPPGAPAYIALAVFRA